MNGSGHSSPRPGSITPPTWLNGLLIGQTVMPCPSCLSEDIWKVLLRPRDSLRHHGLQQLWLLYPQLSLGVCLMSNELVKLSNHLILASPFSICLSPFQNQGLFQGGMWPIQAWFWFQIEPFPALGLPLLSSASSPALEFLFHFKMVPSRDMRMARARPASKMVWRPPGVKGLVQGSVATHRAMLLAKKCRHLNEN